ncbi:MAG: glycosyltransferase, partial [Methylocystaceae bacterium]|nr:glycosyltransferase [Methylocystaceae bacterium]
HIRRTDRSGFKAGACAHGLTLTDEPFIAMLDADFRPPPEWLKRTVPLFLKDPRAGFVQSRCEFQNYETNWLTRAQGLVQDGHYLVEQRSRANAGWLFQFNGTGGVWRRATVEDAGGWSDYSLTEDLDLTVRAAPAAIGIIAAIIGVVLHGSIDPYIGALKLIGLMTLMVVIGITLMPYLVLKRGSVTDYFKTMASVPPLMIYLAFANGAKILQTLRGRKSTFKRTPKLDREGETLDAELE